VKNVSKKEGRQTIDDFVLPYGGKLSADNRWIILKPVLFFGVIWKAAI